MLLQILFCSSRSSRISSRSDPEFELCSGLVRDYCTALYDTILCYILLYGVKCGSELFCTVLYCPVLFCTVLYCTAEIIGGEIGKIKSMDDF